MPCVRIRYPLFVYYVSAKSTNLNTLLINIKYCSTYCYLLYHVFLNVCCVSL